jgi:hypothetical protein
VNTELFSDTFKNQENEKRFTQLLIIFSTVWYSFTILSFKQYFFFIPNFDRNEVVFAYLQCGLLVGWPLFLITSMNFSSRLQSGKQVRSSIFISGIALYTICATLIKICNYIFYKSWNTGYLTEYPIFILTEFLLPLIYIALWRRDKRKKPLKIMHQEA